MNDDNMLNLVTWTNKNFDLTNSFDGQYYTAPYNGIYYFQMTLRSWSSNWGYVYMKVDFIFIFKSRKPISLRFSFFFIIILKSSKICQRQSKSSM